MHGSDQPGLCRSTGPGASVGLSLAEPNPRRFRGRSGDWLGQPQLAGALTSADKTQLGLSTPGR